MGTRIPLSDNPGSSTVPTKIPTSTGRTHSSPDSVSISIDAMHSHPLPWRVPAGNSEATSFIVREPNVAGRTRSVSKAPCLRNLSCKPTSDLTFQLQPGWRVRQLPKLLRQGQLVDDNQVTYLEDLYLEGALVWHLSKTKAIKLWVRSNFINSADLNPFFPMDIPLPGGGLSFTARRW